MNFRIKEVVRIIVVSTLPWLLTLQKPASDSTGKRGVRERCFGVGSWCEADSVLGEYTGLHSFIERNGLTFSELGHTPPFPLERSKFPMDVGSQNSPRQAQPPLFARTSLHLVRVCLLGSQASQNRVLRRLWLSTYGFSRRASHSRQDR